MKRSLSVLMCGVAALAIVTGNSIAQPSAAASAPMSRAEVKGEVKAARANGEIPPDVNQSQIGDPPVPKARKQRKAKSPKSGASTAM